MRRIDLVGLLAVAILGCGGGDRGPSSSTPADSSTSADSSTPVDSSTPTDGANSGFEGATINDAGGNNDDAQPGKDGSPAPNGDGGATPGWNLVAIDTPLRTYLDYVLVPPSGGWTPEANGWPVLAQWEQQATRTGMRFQSFKPGDVAMPQQIIALLPALAVSSQTIDITAAPYNAQVAPADATSAIQAALDAAGAKATKTAPVDVLVPKGTFNHSAVLTVPHDVRLRRSPEDSGGILNATDPNHSAVHLSGDRSAALFLILTCPGTVRTGTPWAGGIWVGPPSAGVPIHEPVVVGNEVSTPSAAHIFALTEEGGLWAFNYAHDGYADTFHHTGGSSYCQVVGNRAQTSATRGDDLYAFVGYAADHDPVHHCSCIANWGRDGKARGLSAVGAGFISFQSNDILRTQSAGVYLAQEDSYVTFGSFDIRVIDNTIAQANLASTHDGLLAYSGSPTGSDTSTTFGTIIHRIERLTIRGNAILDTAAGSGNGYGIEIRSSVDAGDVSGNTLTHNRTPQLVINGTNFTQSNNTLVP